MLQDLTADNILVETSGVCKISDFGISKRTDDINMAAAYTSMQGTVFWMAPEVVNSKGKGYNFNAANDIMGIVMLEIQGAQDLPKLKNSTFSLQLLSICRASDSRCSDSNGLGHGPLRRRVVWKEGFPNSCHPPFAEPAMGGENALPRAPVRDDVQGATYRLRLG